MLNREIHRIIIRHDINAYLTGWDMMQDGIDPEDPERQRMKAAQASSTSRRVYKMNAAAAWRKLIDGSRDFMEGYLHAESISFRKDDEEGEQNGNAKDSDVCCCETACNEGVREIECVGFDCEYSSYPIRARTSSK